MLHAERLQLQRTIGNVNYLKLLMPMPWNRIAGCICMTGSISYAWKFDGSMRL